MASSDNMTTVPAAPTVPKPTPAGSGLTAGDWAGIGIGIAIVSLIVALIGVILTYLRFRADGVCGRLRDGRRRRSNSQRDGGEEGIPLRSMPSTSAETSGSSARQQQPGSSTTHETRLDNPAQRAADKCQEKLKEIYTSTGSYVQMLPWVDDNQKHIMDIYTKLQLEKGDNDLKGEVKSYWDIFKLKTKEGHPIIRAILRGWAGLGKTTLLDKIAYDWACGSVAALKKYKLVFVLKMHSLQQKSDVIDALFDQLLNEKTINREDLKSFITANSEDVLFLLDGFDEFKSTELDEAVFGSILKMLNRKEDYEKCSVLVTTRPSHYDKLVETTLIQRPFALVKVLGFSKGDIEEYVQKFYSEEQSKANGLLERITSSNVLLDLATSPMLLLLMCLLWSTSATLPDTMFRLYNQALLYIFKRKIRMSTEEISKLVIAIGKVALHGLLSFDQKLSFQEEDFEPDVLDMAIRAGILTSQRVCKGIDACKSVHFIHKTVQEYCAAVYYQSVTAKVETQQFETFFREVSDTAGFEYLLRFCCGDNGGPSTNSILKMLSHKVKGAGNLDDRNLQIALNCYFESQSQTLPPIELINSVIAYRFIALADLSRDHSTSLMHFLKNVTDEKKGGEKACLTLIHRLSMPGTVFQRLGDDFVNHVNRMANLHSIRVTGSLTPTQECQNELSRLISSLRLKEMAQLSTVCFKGCVLTRSDMEHIIRELSYLPNLVELDLSGNETLSGSGLAWSQLEEIKTLNKLNLGYCELGSDDLKHIADGLSNRDKLVELDLSHNMTLAWSDQSWSHLMDITTLNKLNLRSCKLGSDDLEPLSKPLSTLLYLVELDLSHNETLAGSGLAWSHLGKIETLNKLNLGYCELGSVDLEPLADGLRNLSKLVELDLSRNMTLAGSDRLWSHLKNIKSLNKLNLGSCKLGSDDLKHIAVGLSDLPKLVELDLYGNMTLAWPDRAQSHLRMKTLNGLNLGYCKLNSDDLKHIADGLIDLPDLVELNLSGNETLAGSGRSWPHLGGINTLNKLNLGNCTLGSDDLEPLANRLRDLPKLVELDLSCNETLSGSGLAWSHLGKTETFNKLNLGYCELGSDDLKPLADGLSNRDKLVELDLSGNMTLAGSDQSWFHLMNIKTLNKLNLGSCKLGSGDLKPIADGLSNLLKLVELDLSRNISLAGSDQSWSHLKNIKTLNKLNLEKCTLGSNDLWPIVYGLRDLQKFAKLDLSRNMTLAGSGQSWRHLGEIKFLNKLNLRSCKLKSNDLEHIAEGLSNLPNLVELDLSINETLAGSGHSWSVLAKMTHLRKLSFGFCFLTADDKTQITKAVSQTTNLKVEY